MGLMAKVPGPSLAWQEGAPLSRDPWGQLAGDPGGPKTGGLSPIPELCKPPHVSLCCDRNDARRHIPRSPSNLVFVPPMPIQVRAVGANWTLLTPRWVCPASPHTHLRGHWAASAWPLAHIQTLHLQNTPKASSTPDFLPASPRPLLACGAPHPGGWKPISPVQAPNLAAILHWHGPLKPRSKVSRSSQRDLPSTSGPSHCSAPGPFCPSDPVQGASPSGPPRLPEATPPDTITVRARFPHRNLGGHTHPVHRLWSHPSHCHKWGFSHPTPTCLG